MTLDPPAPPAAPDVGAATAVSSLQSRAVHGSLWTMLHVIVSVPIAFAANAVVARALGAADYGRLAFLTLVLSIAMSVSNLGVSDGVLQWGAAAHARGDQAEVDSLLRRSLGFHSVVQLPLLIVAVIVLARRDGLFVMGALTLSVALSALLGTAALAIAVENRTAASAKLAMVTNLVTQTAVSLAAVITHMPSAVLAARSLTGSALPLLNFALLDQHRRRVVRQVRLPRHMPVGFWSFSLFTAAGGIVGLLVFSRSELLLLQSFGTPAATGVFALAFGLAQQVTAPVDALLNPLQPAVAGIVEAHPGRVPDTLLRATRISSLLCAGLCAVVFPALFVLIPVIYGTEFTSAAVAFLVLGVTSCLQSAVNPLLTFTRARRQAGSLLGINCAALVIDVVVAVIAIPAWGLWGAILANAAGQVTVIALLIRMECRAWDVALVSYGRAVIMFPCAAAGALSSAVMAGAGLPAPAIILLSFALAAAAVLIVSAITGSRIPYADLKPGLDLFPDRVRRLVSFVLKPVMQ